MTKPTSKNNTRTTYDSDSATRKLNMETTIEIGYEFMKILQDNAFNGIDRADIVSHIAKVLEISEWIKIPNADKDQLRLHVFPISLSGRAREWWDNEIKGIMHKKGMESKILKKAIIISLKYQFLPKSTSGTQMNYANLKNSRSSDTRYGLMKNSSPLVQENITLGEKLMEAYLGSTTTSSTRSFANDTQYGASNLYGYADAIRRPCCKEIDDLDSTCLGLRMMTLLSLKNDMPLRDKSPDTLKIKTGTMTKPTSKNNTRTTYDSDIATRKLNMETTIEIGYEFMKILQDNAFNGIDRANIVSHITKVLEISEWIKIPNADKDQLWLH
ncbi:hypothetical protein Tco_1335870, partial [Tanacetum coccineum]